MSDKLPQKHDHLFKQSLGRKDVMLDFLKSRLPEEIFSKIDQNSLRLTNKSFVGEANLRGDSDLVFEANIEDQPGYIYFLCEHQSEVDQTMPFRFLEYNVLLMRQHLSEGNKTLPVIINICVYNGNHDYNGPTHLLELCENPELVQKYMFQGFHLVNLYGESEELLLQQEKAAFVQLVLKQGIYNEFVAWFKRIYPIFIEFFHKNNIPYHDNLIYYLVIKTKKS